MLNRARINVGRINGPGLAAEPFASPPALVSSVPWQPPRAAGLVALLSHGLGAPGESPAALPFMQGEPAAAGVSLPWDELQPAEVQAGPTWGQGQPDASTTPAAWGLLQPRDQSRASVWGLTAPSGHTVRTWWRAVAPVDIPHAAPWARSEVIERLYGAAWHVPDPLDLQARIPWGFGRPPPTLVPNPNIGDPVDPDPDPRPPVYTPPAGDGVALPFRCRLTDWPGDQVPLPFRRFDCLRREVVVENDIIIRRVDTGDEFQPLEVSLQGDVESFTDGWGARLPHSDSGILSGALEVEVIINGITHLMLLESWTQDAGFAGARQDTFSVRGRSISAELDEPYSAPRSRVEDTTRTALQLMQQELPPGGGWSITAHPGFTDYTVPGGTFSYTDLTPIRAIARIAAASGAVVQQVPGERTLRILPRYTVDPWEQAGAAADVEVDHGMVRAVSGEFRPAALANGVYVAGETSAGVLVEARRAGSNGAPWLDTVTDALITDAQAGLARARAELGASGARTLYQLEMPLVTGADEPGLLVPGQLAAVIEDVSTFWNGQVVGWSLNAQWSDDAGLQVWQNVAVERYTDA